MNRYNQQTAWLASVDCVVIKNEVQVDRKLSWEKLSELRTQEELIGWEETENGEEPTKMIWNRCKS